MAVSAVALAAAAAVGVPGVATAAGATAPTPNVKIVMLPTGDRVKVTGSGAQAVYGQLPGPGAGKSLMSFDNGNGDHYVIPDEAEPFIGRGLDVRLFDVAKIAAQPDGRIPVALGFAAGVTPTAPAGMTLTSVSGSSATGYLTAASAPAFAAALRQQIGADVAAGRTPGSAGLPNGLTAVAPATVAPPKVTPNYPLHILQVNSLDHTGASSPFTVLFITNTDSARMFSAMTFSVNGVARIAVPAGHYSIWAIEQTFDDTGNTGSQWVSIVDGFSMADSGVTTVTTDSRTATAPVTVTTQLPSTPDLSSIGMVRLAADGTGTALSIGSGAGFNTYLTPTQPVTTGKFALQNDFLNDGPASSPVQYKYALDYESDHVPANMAYHADNGGLATVLHDFANDPSYGTDYPIFMQGAETPLVGGGFEAGRQLAALGPLVVFTSPGAKWLTEVDEDFFSDPNGNFYPGASFTADPVSYRAGQFATRDWMRAPIAPRFGQHPADTLNPYGCQACVAGGGLVLGLSPVGDSNADTTGLDYGSTTNVTVSWNGQPLASSQFPGVYVPTVPAGPGTIEEVMDVDRTPTGVTQSTASHTDVVIPYSGQSDPTSALPSGVYCAIPTTDVCQILPVLTIDYHLQALDGANTSHAKVQNLGLDIGHLSYGTFGSNAAITSAKVSVSFDGGTTWQDVATHGARGHYDAHWTNPAAGSHLTLRVTATDALGGSISQTITDPYTVG